MFNDSSCRLPLYSQNPCDLQATCIRSIGPRSAARWFSYLTANGVQAGFSHSRSSSTPGGFTISYGQLTVPEKTFSLMDNLRSLRLVEVPVLFLVVANRTIDVDYLRRRPLGSLFSFLFFLFFSFFSFCFICSAEGFGIRLGFFLLFRPLAHCHEEVGPTRDYQLLVQTHIVFIRSEVSAFINNYSKESSRIHHP